WGDAMTAHLCVEMQRIAFVEAEVDVDRHQLVERRQCRRPVGANEITGIDLPRADPSREGGGDLGVAEIDLRQLHLGLCLVTLAQLLLDTRYSRSVFLDQLLLPLELGLRLLQSRLVQCKLLLVLLWVNHKENLAGFHKGAILKTYRLEVAADTRDQVYSFRWSDRASQIEVLGHGPLQGPTDGHSWQRLANFGRFPATDKE